MTLPPSRGEMRIDKTKEIAGSLFTLDPQYSASLTNPSSVMWLLAVMDPGKSWKIPCESRSKSWLPEGGASVHAAFKT